MDARMRGCEDAYLTNICYCTSINSNLEQDANASNPIKLIKRVFNNDKFGDTFLLENGKVMWNSSRIQQTDSTQLFEFDILINEKKAIINEFYADTIHYSLLANLDKKQNVQLHVLEWIPTRANKYSKPDYVNKNSFSGLLNMYSLDGQLIEAAFYKAGNQKSKLPNLQIKERRDQIMEEKLVLKAPPIGGCDCWVAVWADNYTYWYQTVGSGSSSITTYLGTEFTGRTLIYVYMPSDGGGGNGYYEQTETRTAVHGPRYSSSYSSKAQFYDEQVLLDKSFATNEWLKCIYDRLVEVDAFRQALLRFTGEYPVIHLRFDVGDIASHPEAFAAIYPPNNYVSRIRVNTKYSSNFSTLLMAKTLIHEVMHAEMYRKLMELANSDGRIDKLLVEMFLSENNYPGLFDYFQRYGFDTMQHELMAAHYVDIMTDILAEFDNYNLTFDYYEAFVWSGSLAGTSSYSNLSETLRKSIDSLYSKEYYYGDKSCTN